MLSLLLKNDTRNYEIKISKLLAKQRSRVELEENEQMWRVVWTEAQKSVMTHSVCSAISVC